MKSVYVLVAALLVLALGWLGWQKLHPAQSIALLDIERIIAESAPGKAGRAHMDKVDQHFRQGLEQLHRNYQQASAEEQQRVIGNAEQMLSQQFSLQERVVSEDLKKIILDEAEKWRRKQGIRLVLPAQLALAQSGDLDCTDEVLQAVNRREMTFARLPELNILQPTPDVQQAPATGLPGTMQQHSPGKPATGK